MLFEFLWNKGSDRISRMQIVKNIEAGGLRMTNVKAFITSFKVTWLRRIITNFNTNNWIFAHIVIRKVKVTCTYLQDAI